MIQNKLDLYNVIIAPLNTEKARSSDNKDDKVDNKKFVFKVLKSATKKQIKDAVEYCFQIQVEKVNVLNVEGKVKRFRQKAGKTASWKKAYVTIKPGQKFDLYKD